MTILNSIILILIIGVLSTVVYSYLKALLYSDLDEDLKRMMVRFEEVAQSGYIPLDPALGKPAFVRDPRITMLLWDENNKVIDWNDSNSLFANNSNKFLPEKIGKLEEKSAEGYYFRSIANTFQTPMGEVKVQLLRNVNTEQELLDRLQLILTIGTIIGGFVSIAAGFYLADKAFIPIKEAWGKQQQFVSDASHELRTPLAVIQSKSELLLRAPDSTIEEKASEISVIIRECRRLTRLVSNLLLLTRSDSNEIQIERKDFSLTELLQEVIENYSEIALYQGKQMELNTEEQVTVTGDKEKIHQLIVILLDNAMKFTNEGGRIDVLCRNLGNSVELLVKDNGIGIEKDILPKIFDRFFQGEQSRTTSEGAGLGLSIAKWIIDQHQAKINVDSVVGKGTAIKIIFPK